VPDTTNTHELLVTTFATADTVGKVVNREGSHYAGRVHGKGFRRTGNVSKTSES